MTIKTIDKAAATRISDEIFVALADLPEKLGVDIRPGGGSYSDGNLTLKIIIATRNGDGTVNTPEADSFRQYAHQIGLEPEDLGREFTNNTGDRCSLVGYKPRSRPYLSTSLTRPLN